MADRQFVLGGVEAAPADWIPPAALELVPKTAFAIFDGSGASGAFLPCLEIISDSGHTVAICRTEDTVAAGASAVVSFFPGGELDTQTTDGGSGGGTITSVSSPTGTVLVGLPNGPDTTVDLPPSGVSAGTYGDALDVAQVTLDAEGRVTGAANVPIASGAGGGFVQVAQASRTAGDLTTSSTSFVDATGLTVTLTTGAHRCLVFFIANCHNSSGTANVAVDLAIDGTRQGQTYGLVLNQASTTGEPNTSVAFTYLTAALSAGSHTIKIQWRVDGGTGTMFASTTITPAILTVCELGI